ncbi:related to DNA-directed RNA polymerase II accessory protein [Cephalotrichum gorgonifer]|uniref:Related to DNA-directed RNA polymerase II accessory protein n=1 Tax=Cephalotrichum gorgonifer TaxID=2041049 RepID=A0AAE8SRU6_9PEZI|nr:related to DNA-directed RNA polymerase II accessory protein [Cephalotrichum gorgonifer]
MAASTEHDPLLLLRQSISANKPAIPVSAPEPAAPAAPLAQATHLRFPHAADLVIPIAAPTRFVTSAEKGVNVRSIYFAWLNREVAIPEYNASAARLNGEIKEAGGSGEVRNLAFVERLDLITWLEGASEESEYITPLEGEKGEGAKGGVGALSGKVDPRLAAIYSHERRMGDRNSVLRGAKPTDFSHVRKLATVFVQRKPQHPASSSLGDPSAPSSRSAARRPDPIILLSPSASSLLRLANIRAFLEEGRFTPPEGPGTGASMLHVTRAMRDIDPSRPVRFILVEGPEQFKPEYWNRVVAVFTTGQAWQFKSYKWTAPPELFKHVLGVYVGWRGDKVPDTVVGWGHRIVTCAVDRWREGSGVEGARFRDKEVVEGIWKAIEANMRAKGWRKDAAPVRI